MSQYDNNMTGVLFPNDSENEKAPAFTGTAEVEGVEYRIAGWKRRSNTSGKPFISIKFENKEEWEAARADVDPEGALDL